MRLKSFIIILILFFITLKIFSGPPPIPTLKTTFEVIDTNQIVNTNPPLPNITVSLTWARQPNMVYDIEMSRDLITWRDIFCNVSFTTMNWIYPKSNLSNFLGNRFFYILGYTYTFDTNGYLPLAWNSCPDTNIVTYNLYYGLTSELEFDIGMSMTEIINIPITKTYYVLTNLLSSNQYSMYITGSDTNGNETAPCDTLNATPFPYYKHLTTNHIAATLNVSQ